MKYTAFMSYFAIKSEWRKFAKYVSKIACIAIIGELKFLKVVFI